MSDIQTAVRKSWKRILRRAAPRRPQSPIQRMLESIQDHIAARDLSGPAGVAFGATIATLVPFLVRAGKGRRLPIIEHAAHPARDEFWAKLPHAGTTPRRPTPRPRSVNRNQDGR